MNKSKIIFCERIWSPVTGCEHISDLCSFCWADTLAENKRGLKSYPNGFDITFKEERLKEPSKTSLVFVGSQTDLFLYKIPDEYRDKIFDEIEANPRHEFMIFTKRPGKMLRYSLRRRFPKNAWAIISIGLVSEVKMIDILKKIDVEVRGLSVEPLLEKLPPLDSGTCRTTAELTELHFSSNNGVGVTLKSRGENWMGNSIQKYRGILRVRRKSTMRISKRLKEDLEPS